MSYIDPLNLPGPYPPEVLDRILGVSETPQDNTVEQMPGRSFLENFSGLEGQNFGRPSNFLEGLISGTTQGLGRQGTRAAAQRAQFEAQALERQKERNKANLDASAKLRESRSKGLADLNRRTADEGRKNKDYERDNVIPTPEQLKAAPWLARVTDANGRVPQATLVTAFKPDNTPGTKEPKLVEVTAPDGSQSLVPSRPGLVTKPPGGGEKLKPPSAAERDNLVSDIGTLSQVNDIRSAFKPEFVGPASGRYGAVTQATGVGKRAGEGKFRARLAGLRNQILKLRSGGAVSDGEAARLLEELPTPEDPSESFTAKLDEFENTYRTIAQARRDIFGSTGVDVSRVPALPERPQPVLVTAPNGKTYSFANAGAAAQFKRRAGIN